ncbi:MAG TPA: thymidine phosphorylase [Longimicrobiaceae bacterium]|nr:thymidine phosphorylase [Longimicrobiaceae bacterium]
MSQEGESTGEVNTVAIIERKKRGGELTPDELAWICKGYVYGAVPVYQVAAWLMAICWRGMTEAETLALTQAMVTTGATLDWRDLPLPAVDKHSTGGVGDKTSLVLVPLIAAAGLPFVKMSGRGLGHTGGTLDKLESIPGFRVELEPDAMRAQVERIGCALVGQSAELVPADGMLYALRDVTATVDCLPLIASSIMSKKLAAGAAVIVLDVKYGSGAFMPTVEEARALAQQMVGIGEGAGRRIRAVLSAMEEPLGRTVGNALEVREAIETLCGGGPADLWDLTLELGSHLMVLAAAAADLEEARARLTVLRDSGAAAERFAELIRAQGGDPEVVADPERLPQAPLVIPFVSEHAEEYSVQRVDARGIADAALLLGAGRRTKSDPVDHRVGVRVFARVGDRIAPGQPLAEIHAPSAERAKEAGSLLRRAFVLQLDPVERPARRTEVIGAG